MPPAETPTECEACKTYLRSEPSHIALNEWLKMFDEHHRIIAAKDARIRELEGTLRFIATEWDLKPTIKELRSRAKAALAPAEV